MTDRITLSNGTVYEMHWPDMHVGFRRFVGAPMPKGAMQECVESIHFTLRLYHPIDAGMAVLATLTDMLVDKVESEDELTEITQQMVEVLPDLLKRAYQTKLETRP